MKKGILRLLFLGILTIFFATTLVNANYYEGNTSEIRLNLPKEHICDSCNNPGKITKFSLPIIKIKNNKRGEALLKCLNSWVQTADEISDSIDFPFIFELWLFPYNDKFPQIIDKNNPYFEKFPHLFDENNLNLTNFKYNEVIAIGISIIHRLPNSSFKGVINLRSEKGKDTYFFLTGDNMYGYEFSFHRFFYQDEDSIRFSLVPTDTIKLPFMMNNDHIEMDSLTSGLIYYWWK